MPHLVSSTEGMPGDLTDAQQASLLRCQANRCRRLANSTNDDLARETLHRMADEYDTKALRLQARTAFPARREA